VAAALRTIDKGGGGSAEAGAAAAAAVAELGANANALLARMQRLAAARHANLMHKLNARGQTTRGKGRPPCTCFRNSPVAGSAGRRVLILFPGGTRRPFGRRAPDTWPPFCPCP